MAHYLTPSICRLSDNGDNLAHWHLMIVTYAESIGGLTILNGTKPRPGLPPTTPPPMFAGNPLDPAKYNASQATWRKLHDIELVAFDQAYKNLREWEEIDANLRLKIITMIPEKHLGLIMEEERTSAAYLNLIIKYPRGCRTV